VAAAAAAVRWWWPLSWSSRPLKRRPSAAISHAFLSPCRAPAGRSRGSIRRPQSHSSVQPVLGFLSFPCTTNGVGNKLTFTGLVCCPRTTEHSRPGDIIRRFWLPSPPRPPACAHQRAAQFPGLAPQRKPSRNTEMVSTYAKTLKLYNDDDERAGWSRGGALGRQHDHFFLPPDFRALDVSRLPMYCLTSSMMLSRDWGICTSSSSPLSSSPEAYSSMAGGAIWIF
jgi:hypothetical protein